MKKVTTMILMVVLIIMVNQRVNANESAGVTDFSNFKRLVEISGEKSIVYEISDFPENSKKDIYNLYIEDTNKNSRIKSMSFNEKNISKIKIYKSVDKYFILGLDKRALNLIEFSDDGSAKVKEIIENIDIEFINNREDLEVLSESNSSGILCYNKKKNLLLMYRNGEESLIDSNVVLAGISSNNKIITYNKDGKWLTYDDADYNKVSYEAQVMVTELVLEGDKITLEVIFDEGMGELNKVKFTVPESWKNIPTEITGLNW